MTGLRCEYSQAEVLGTCSSLKVNEDFLAPLKECPNFLEEFNLNPIHESKAFKPSENQKSWV